ncbi:hypothetical protein DN748_07600 [Sinomicrobium soli]|nr:hypothetical protein DN748_07600 [Sinomicrobium sp. N-1-3-6]
MRVLFGILVKDTSITSWKEWRSLDYTRDDKIDVIQTKGKNLHPRAKKLQQYNGEPGDSSPTNLSRASGKVGTGTTVGMTKPLQTQEDHFKTIVFSYKQPEFNNKTQSKPACLQPFSACFGFSAHHCAPCRLKAA